ncbi:hypothetical protein JTE90_006763 [Oedothorax gibbosus]|uniref:Uncharacterized protein n=1 Tax=Oedothorax gibbosus TaxID=931172 RepID=A0AAV6UJQ5_9ARAC|nr:hypothetical protein JTE90_006763 [Oedothorax gibbosus]
MASENSLRITPLYKKHNTNVAQDICVPLLGIINTLQGTIDPSTSSIEKDIYLIARDMAKFMKTYYKTQLSYGTQNVLAGEFIVPLVNSLLSVKGQPLLSPRTTDSRSPSPGGGFKRSFSVLDTDLRRAKLDLAEFHKQIRSLQENLKTASILQDQLKEANNKIKVLEEDIKTHIATQ